jgi:hypothetical protein
MLQSRLAHFWDHFPISALKRQRPRLLQQTPRLLRDGEDGQDLLHLQ